MTRPSITCVWLLLMHTAACAQSESSSASSKLGDYEATYQSGLRKIQAPLLSGYVAKLQQLSVTAPPPERPAIQAEQERVEKIIASGGIVDLRSASSTQPQDQRPGAGPGGRPPPGAVLVLRPDTAKGPAVLGATLTIGKARWTLASLEAGSYDISIVCAYPPFKGSASISAALAGDETSEILSEARGTTAPDQFRFIRLGKIRVKDDVKNEDLTLTLNATDLPGVQVRQVIISKPQPPP